MIFYARRVLRNSRILHLTMKYRFKLFQSQIRVQRSNEVYQLLQGQKSDFVLHYKDEEGNLLIHR